MSSRDNARPGPRLPIWKKALYALAAVFLVLALLEGTSSLGLFAWDLLAHTSRPVAERQHTTYDPELGWVSVPGLAVQDLYGPGRSVTINSQGFRNSREFPVAVPPGKVRVVCSGDSFTFGYGVDDRDAWTSVLDRAKPALEVVNMGQGGYGVDQIYLWYERDGRKISHQVHLFVVIPEDFYRMRYRTFVGYPKPTLRLEDGVPVADGVPVPRRAFFVPWITQNAAILRGLRSAQLVSKVLGLGSAAAGVPVMSPRQALLLAALALQHTAAEDSAHDSRLVVVWLPTEPQETPGPEDAVRLGLEREMQARGIPMVDLVDGFRALPQDQMPALFLTPEEVDYPGAAGHYTVEGNRYVARRLDEELSRLEALQGVWP